MSPFFKILKYQLRDIIRSKWVIIYGLFFLLLSEALFQFSGDTSKTLVSLLNVTMILIPVVSIIFGTIYVYNSREFIELILSQPLKRKTLFSGMYFGLSLPLAFTFLIGIGIPILLHGSSDISALLSLMISGLLLTFIFTGIAIIISLKYEDKAFGIGISFIIWLFLAVLYDGIIMLLIWQFSDYPLEMFTLVATLINPVDLGRTLVMLKLNIAALMGYTGAVFEQFFSGMIGIVISIFMMIIWIVIPYFIGKRIFRKKNF